MNSRLYLPGIFWLGAMLLLFSAPVQDSNTTLMHVSGRMILEFLVFAGFVHVWIAALKKQIGYDSVRRNALWIVFCLAVVLVFLMELGILYFQKTEQLRFDHIAMNIVGASSGILSFKLIYRRCC